MVLSSLKKNQYTMINISLLVITS